GANFEDDVTGPQLGLIENVLDQVHVDQKVLSQVRARMKAVPLEEAHQHRPGLALGGSHLAIIHRRSAAVTPSVERRVQGVRRASANWKWRALTQFPPPRGGRE